MAVAFVGALASGVYKEMLGYNTYVLVVLVVIIVGSFSSIMTWLGNNIDSVNLVVERWKILGYTVNADLSE